MPEHHDCYSSLPPERRGRQAGTSVQGSEATRKLGVTAQGQFVLDAHNHLGFAGQLEDRVFLAEDLVAHMDDAGVARACIFPFYSFRDWEESIGYILEAAQRYPDRLVPFGMVNPWRRNEVEALEPLLRDGKLKGLKLHPYGHGYNLDMYHLTDPIFAMCGKYGIPIVSHGLGDNPWTSVWGFAAMAERFPNVPLVMFHAGHMWAVWQAIAAAKRYPNLYLGTTCLTTREVRDVYENVGPKKMIFESDTPWGDFRVELVKVRTAVANEEDRRAIFGGNLARLLGVPAAMAA